MPADIEEGPERAVLAAHHQDRHAAQIVGAVVAGIGQLAGEAEEQRVAAKEHVLLALRLPGAGVGRNGIEIDGLRQFRRAALDEVNHTARERDLGRMLHSGFSPSWLPLTARNRPQQ